MAQYAKGHWTVGFRIGTRSHYAKVKSGAVADRVYNQLPTQSGPTQVLRERSVVDPRDPFMRDVPTLPEKEALRLLLEKLKKVVTNAY